MAEVKDSEPPMPPEVAEAVEGPQLPAKLERQRSGKAR